MKSHRTNSFRLHNIAKTSLVNKQSQSFYEPNETFKLAAINSVSRSVKHADLSFLTGQNLNKLRNEPLQNNEGMYVSAHQNLADVRKKYDDINQAKVSLEITIAQLREQASAYNFINAEGNNYTKEGREKVQRLQKQLWDKKNQLQIATADKKVLLNMQLRQKRDKIHYDQVKYNAQEQLAFYKRQMKIYIKEGYEIKESQCRSGSVFEQLTKGLEVGQHQRGQHIRNVESLIKEKNCLIVANQLREQDLYEIAQRAMQDKDQNEKQWRNVYLTHTFINKLLRNKIENQMKKFHVIESAFKEIKTQTGVCNSDILISNYLNKQMAYGELLSKIADNQKSIESLKNQSEQLIKQHGKLQMQLENIQSVKIKSKQLNNELKKLQLYDVKAEKYEIFQTKITQWLSRQLKKLGTTDKHHNQNEESIKDQTIVDNFKKYLQIISSEVDRGVIDVSIMNQYSAESLSIRDTDKIDRIFPKKSRKNSYAQEIVDLNQQQTNPSTNIEQQHLINAARQEMIKKNQKFMFDLQKRKKQDKKILIDKVDIKKEKVAAKGVEPKIQEF